MEGEEHPVSVDTLPGAEPMAWRVCDDKGRVLGGVREAALAGENPSCAFSGACRSR